MQLFFFIIRYQHCLYFKKFWLALLISVYSSLNPKSLRLLCGSFSPFSTWSYIKLTFNISIFFTATIMIAVYKYACSTTSWHIYQYQKHLCRPSQPISPHSILIEAKVLNIRLQDQYTTGGGFSYRIVDIGLYIGICLHIWVLILKIIYTTNIP